MLGNTFSLSLQHWCK